ncbi:MAG: DUF6916 family protein [Streptosporangiaceae bacterium]
MTSERSLDTLTAEDFRDHKNTRFRMTGDGSPASFEAELVSVTEYTDNASGTFRTPFSVLFHGPLEPVLPQGTYRLEHDGLGTLDLFIVPVGPDTPEPESEPTAMRYEAVFG